MIHFFSRTLLEVVSCAVLSWPEIRGLCLCASKFTPTGMLFLFFFCLVVIHSFTQRLPCLDDIRAVALRTGNDLAWTKEDVLHVNFSLICFNPLFVWIWVMFFAIEPGRASAVDLEALVGADRSILCVGVVLRSIDQNGMFVNGLQCPKST